MGIVTVEKIGKKVWLLLKKIKNRSTIYFRNSNSGYLSEKIKAIIRKYICTNTITAALFTIANPRAHSWIKKIIHTYICTTEHNSAIEKNEILLVETM